MRPRGAHPIYWRTITVVPPVDWEIRSVASMTTHFKGKLPDSLLERPTESSIPYLLVQAYDENRNLYTEDSTLPSIEECDTVVVSDGSRSGLALRGRCGALGSTLLCYRPKPGINGGFLFYLLQSLYGFTNTATIGGAVPHLDKNLLDKLELNVPHESEQETISELLVIVDVCLKAAEKKLTASLWLKTALMQQLFTHGIPGLHTRFKQTKIGEIPAGWDVVSIKSVLEGSAFNGVSPQSRPKPPGTPILNVECIHDGICTTRHVTYVDVDEDTKEECRAKKGDFYVLRGNGNRDYVATGGLLSEEPEVPMIFSDKLIRLRFQPSKVVERFVPYLWQSSAFLRRIRSKAESSSGLWMISKRDIRRELFACPSSKDEQEQIVSLIDVAIANIAACESALRALDRIKRSLLQNLLTGRVRVRI